MDKQTILMEYIQNELMKGRSQKFSVEEDLLSSGILDCSGFCSWLHILMTNSIFKFQMKMSFTKALIP